MLINIDIDPSQLSEAELEACTQYATEKNLALELFNSYSDLIDCSQERFEELLRGMYEHFAKQTDPAPPPVKDFFWHTLGKLV